MQRDVMHERVIIAGESLASDSYRFTAYSARRPSIILVLVVRAVQHLTLMIAERACKQGV